MKRYALLLTLILTGCASQPADVSARYLADSPRYTVTGLQGWMPGTNIRFGQYAGEVSKGWITSKSNVLSDVLMSSSSSQEISIKQTGPTGNQANLQYRHRCSKQGLNFSTNGWINHDDVARLEQLTGLLQVGQTTWQLSNNLLIDPQGNQFKIINDNVLYNGAVIAEFQRDVAIGNFQSADYLWLNETAPADIQLIAATLITYTISYDSLTCSQDELE